MDMTISGLPTPAILMDVRAAGRNIRWMQARCDATGTALWPHCKTHKLIPVLRMQLEAGAAGATVAKVSEAETLIDAGLRRLFVAHSLVSPGVAPRLKSLAGRLDELVLAVTSPGQYHALARILDEADLDADIALAVDTGLDREGARSPECARALSGTIRANRRMNLRAIYTHEGHAYSTEGSLAEFAGLIHENLLRFREAIGGNLPLWPGCSVTAFEMCGREGVEVVRPGAYVFGDLNLCETHPVIPWENAAVTVLSTVVDRPVDTLALIDAGSKVFSSDRSRSGLLGRSADGGGCEVFRASEEHGFVRGTVLPEVGDRRRFVPAHICPVLNLTDEVHVVDGSDIISRWRVDARGKTT